MSSAAIKTVDGSERENMWRKLLVTSTYNLFLVKKFGRATVCGNAHYPPKNKDAATRRFTPEWV